MTDQKPYPVRVAEKLRNIEEHRPLEIQAAADLIETMFVVIVEVYSQCGNDSPAIKRHALTPQIRDKMRDLIYKRQP